MAITYATSGQFNAGASQTVNVGSGSNRLLTFFILTNSGTDVSPTATYNSVSMTRIGGLKSNGSNTWVYTFVLPNPAINSNTFTVSGATVWGSIFIVHNGVVQLSDPTGYAGKTVTGTNTGGTLTVVTSVNNSWTSWGCVADEALTASTGLNIRLSSGAFQVGDSGGDIASPTSYDMVFTKASNANLWAVQGAAFAPLVAGPVNLKTYDTNIKANIKSINTNLIANVKSLNTNV